MRRISLVLLAISLQAGDIRISEVMANPQGSEYENEFIELYNTSGHVIHIKGWVISDGTGIDSLIHLSGPEGLQPAAYAVILDPSYNFSTGPYHDLMPDSTSLYTISTDATLGSGGLSNSGESAIIRSPDSSTVSWMSWTRATDNGHSWERVSLEVPDSVAEWEQSLVKDGTPGYRNSRELPQFNLSLGTIGINQSEGSQGFDLEVPVINMGSSDMNNAELKVQVLDRNELIHQEEETILEISSGDSLIWSRKVELDRCGWISVKIEINHPGDEFMDDNLAEDEVYISCLESPLIINEIMPIPLVEEPEWVEIYNKSWFEVDLKGWQISDNNSNGKTITDSSLILDAHEYLLLSTQNDIEGCPWACQIVVVSGFPTLNNSGDAVLLMDTQGQIMDEMSYNEGSALVEGRSWERINTNKPSRDPNNWGFCISASASTPGYKNSLHLTKLSSDLILELDPNPFTPNGDGDKDKLIIQYELPFEQGLVSMVIYDMAGRIIAEPYPAKAVAHRGQLLWDGGANYGGSQ